MSITFVCPQCRKSQRADITAADPQLHCPACDWSREVSPPGDAEGVKACLRCGNNDLWRQKDFPQWLGLTFVVVGAVASSIAWGYHRPALALGILMGFALLDMILYLVMPDVLVCYRCQTRHHGVSLEGHHGFNHELAERYRQERLRLQRSATTSTPSVDG